MVADVFWTISTRIENGKSLAGIQKVKHRINLWPSKSRYSQRYENRLKHSCTQMLTVALFRIAKR